MNTPASQLRVDSLRWIGAVNSPFAPPAPGRPER